MNSFKDLCEECTNVATNTVGDLKLCTDHYAEFTDELETQSDLLQDTCATG